MSVSEEVKQRRIKKGLNRTQLAELCGMSAFWLERFENGLSKFDPPSKILFQISQALGTTVADLKRAHIREMSACTILMNAATMTVDGTYERREITEKEFVRRIKIADENRLLKSYIGHERTATHIARITGVPIEYSREDTFITMYDNIIVCKLKNRVANRNITQRPSPGDFQYLEVMYKGRYNL